MFGGGRLGAEYRVKTAHIGAERRHGTIVSIVMNG
jgi:hypothetical protein